MNHLELINSLYPYFPKDIDYYNEKYQDSEEYQFLAKVCDIADTDKQTYLQLLEELNGIANTVDFTQLFARDRCFRLLTNVSYDFSLLTSISIIAPYFIFQTFYNTGGRRESFDVSQVPDILMEKISVIIHKIFPAYSLLPEELRDIAVKEISLPRTPLGEVTIAKAIFTDASI
ncbi:hypothetical protein [Pedobacter sp. GR22-10]|uniref:hypothetical protein n=1 Tax=Pedobacter sp. GR22-10 TaxID=2994472 RepID=UPI0022467606|nr:hypothetical protein [Pedobacter sp. GR22-10]MCX2432839.1 hypothetical protein [Pedobacter sp. GR22-10]